VYEGLHDTRQGLSDDDTNRIGIMTARLLDPWDRWVHRRVERVTFCDEDALRRDVSIDFTLPYWFHELRETSCKQAMRQLVPLGFLRKGALVNFSLRNERDESLPLLNVPQNSQVAQAVLMALAQEGLQDPQENLDSQKPQDSVPPEICCDIRDLVREEPYTAENTYERLFSTPDKAWQAREKLSNHQPFVTAADLFCRHFLALSMLDIARHERRIVHLSYEEPLSYEESLSDTERFVRVAKQIAGQARMLIVGVTSLSEAASYHIEVEAPTGLMISKRESYYLEGQGAAAKPFIRGGGFERAHFHFSNRPSQSLATVAVHLRPRKSSGVRAATLMSLFTLIATSAVTFRFPHIEKIGDNNAAAAALLLAAAGIIGLVVVRSGEDEMATTLLFPLRVLASIPVILAALAAVVIVIDPTAWVGYMVLGIISALIAVSAGLLIWNWRAIRIASRKQ
jgi:hypothetical protein